MPRRPPGWRRHWLVRKPSAYPCLPFGPSALLQVILVEPGLRHLDILERLATEAKATGPLLSDAVLAAIAIENGATLASTDRDFARFEGLRWINPLAAPGR